MIAGESCFESDRKHEDDARSPSSSSACCLFMYTALSLVLSKEAANSKMPLSFIRISALLPSVRPPLLAGLISIPRKFEPSIGCSNFVDSIDVSGIDRDSNVGLRCDTSATKISCDQYAG